MVSVAGVTDTAISNTVIAAGVSQTGILTTANVSEVTNLYYTAARAYANTNAITTLNNLTNVGTITGGTWHGNSISTTYTDAKITAVAGQTGSISNVQLASAINQTGIFTTANVTELTNLYYTDARSYANTNAIVRLNNLTNVGTIAGGTWQGNSISTTYTDAKITAVAGQTGSISNVQLASAVNQTGILTTANVSEVTNLYYTNARVYAAVTGNLNAKANVADLTTANVSELTNLYFTAARAYSNTTAITSLTNLTTVGTLGNLAVSGTTTTNTANVTTLNFADGTTQTSSGVSAGFVLAMSIALA